MIPVNESNRRATTFGLSLPIDMLNRLDSLRGDIPRSKFINRLLKVALEIEEKEKSKK